MSEFKHTPGPWCRNIKPGKKYPTVYAGRNTHIAVAQSLGLTDEEVEANIDLITAAPALLEGLRNAVRWLDAIEQKLGRETFLSYMPNCCLGRNDMKAAIERAEGK